MSDTKLKLSRRSLLKSMGAFGASSALFGCSKNDSDDLVYFPNGNLSDEITIPKEEEMRVVTGGAARACGHLCVLKAHVKDGVIKRFTSDDILDEEISKDSPFGRLQSRACLKCRSWTYMLYNSNRLLYPLMQTGERGDLSGFKVVSWDTAMKRIKTDFDRIRSTYGPGAVLQDQSGGTGGAAGFFLGFNTMLGGNIATRQDFSQGCWEHVANFVRPQRYTDFGVTWAPNAPFDYGTTRDARTGWIKGITGYNIVANAITDLFNSEHIVLWSANPAETFGTHHANFYLKRMKESGIKFTVIDQRNSPSVSTYADTFLSPVQNTDAALVMAIIHSILTDHIEDFKKLHGANDEAELKAAINKYIYGFFDEDNPTTYNARQTIKNEIFGDADFPIISDAEFAAKYNVPDGASWSAYIFGSSDALVKRGLNKATSIYPNKIGYCIRDYDYPNEGDDKLKGKYVPTYSSVEKTPEWAEKITGVPAASIRAFAKELVTKKTTIYIGFGLQRQHEGEQATWSILLLGSLILSFGANGQSTGIPRGPGFVNQNDRFDFSKWLPPAYIHAGTVPVLQDVFKFSTAVPGGYMNGTNIDYSALGFHDTAKVSFPALTDTYTRYSIPIKEMYDAIGATNQKKVNTKTIKKDGNGKWIETTEEVYPSLWNDGQVQRLPRPIKAIITIGSNKIASNGADVNRTIRNLRETDDVSGHPKKYKVEIVVCVDAFMTGTARYADIILPSAATFEKYIAPNSSQGNEVVCIHGGKAVEPQGQSMNDIDMGWEFYKQWGTDNESKNVLYEAYYKGCKPDADMGADEKVVRSFWENPAVQRPFPYEEWKKKGVHYAKQYGYKEYAIPEDPSQFTRINHQTDLFVWNKEFRKQPENYPLHTPSGKIEAFCQAMIEDFEARNFFNYDPNITLSKPLKFAGTPDGWETRGRYAYPVPMYIPTIEGCHACDNDESAPTTDCSNPNEAVSGYTKHPNPLGFEVGFEYTMCNYHPIQRAHTLHNANPVINELFKYNSKGGYAAYNSENGVNIELTAPIIMTDDVYEPALLNVNAKYADNSPIMNGDIIIVESERGKGLYSAKLTKRIKPNQVSIAQGSAYNTTAINGNKDDIDKGGSTGTHISQRPSRFGRGFTASDIRVRITKA